MNESTRELAQTGKPVAIVGDDLRAFHPRYAELSRKDPLNAAHYTDQDSGRWVEMLIAAAKEKRVNVVIEGTMRRPEKVAQTMQELKAG
ncbi:zeta toxin family protein, partial [Acinetobacter baumannii]